MKNYFLKLAIASGISLVCVTSMRAQPLSINTLAGDPAPGSLDGVGVNARFNHPNGIAVDSVGNIYVADTANGTIRKIATNQTVTTFAGFAGNFGSANGTGTNAQFSAPHGIAFDNAGVLYVADTANATIRKITAAGVVSTFAGLPGIANSFDGTGTNAQFFRPEGLAVDTDGNVYVADTWNHTIRKITSAGVVSTLAGLAGSPGGRDGTNNKARFNRPTGIAVDGAANLFVTDSFNHTVRKITPDGTVSTIAGLAGLWGHVDGTNKVARFFQPQGIVLDDSGNLFVVDSGNQVVRKISPDGTNWVVTTVAGSSGNAGNDDGANDLARFYFPSGIARDGAGRLHVAEVGNNMVRTERAVISFSLQASANPTNGGTISISPDQSRFGSGGIVTLTATPVPGYSFAGWSGDFVTTNNPINILMTTNTAVVAHFLNTTELIVDNPEATYSGVWTIGSAGGDKYGSYYQYAQTTTGANAAHAFYRPNIVVPGKYDVSLWYPQGTNRTSNAQISIISGENVFPTSIDQTTGGGSWQLVAAGIDFVAGTNGFVDISNVTGENNKIIVADAVRFSRQNAPVILSQPQSRTVQTGANATFNVLVGGSGPMSYQWRVNDAEIPGATASSYALSNVQLEDTGDYTVVVSNQIDTVISEIAALVVVQPAQFGSISILPGGQFQFTLNGESFVNYAIEGSTNLVDWVVLTNLSSPDGILEFIDPEVNLEKRFYRARSEP